MRKLRSAAVSLLLGASLLAQAVLPGSAAFAEGPAPQQVLEENTSYNNTGETPLSASNGYSGFNPFYEKEIEPNDLTEHNQRYTLIGGEHFVFSGSINGHENDFYDFFPFEAVESGYMSVIVKELSTFGILNVDVVDEAENELDDDYENLTSEQHNIYLEKGRQYFVRVTPRPGMFAHGIAYQALIGFSSAPSDVLEPNHTSKEAALLQFGNVTEATLHDGSDEDWYKFYTSYVNQTINVSLHSIPAGADYHVAVYDQNLNELRNTKTSGSKQLTEIFAAKDSVLYVKVYSLGGSSSSDSYELNVNVATAMDSFEPNNTAASATAMAGKSYIYGTIHDAADQDWYYFIPEWYDQLADISVFDVPGGSDYQVKLYDENANLLSASTIANDGSRVIKGAKVTKGKKYYLQVYAVSGFDKNASYQIKVKPSVYMDSF